MRRPYTTPCLAPYDVPAKERRGHVCLTSASLSGWTVQAYRLASCFPIPADDVLEGVKKSVRYLTTSKHARMYKGKDNPGSRCPLAGLGLISMQPARLPVPSSYQKRNVPCRLLLLHGEVALVLVALMLAPV